MDFRTEEEKENGERVTLISCQPLCFFSLNMHVYFREAHVSNIFSKSKIIKERVKNKRHAPAIFLLSDFIYN